MKAIFTGGAWTDKKLDHLIRAAAEIMDPGERIAFLSSHFLGVPYGEDTLTGSPSITEELVANLADLDCFTFIDYIEAMRLSHSLHEFPDNLKKARYRSGLVSYTARNHFFTDWRENNRGFVDDVTCAVGGQKAVKVGKSLNRKENGSLFLEGIPIVEREVSCIPSHKVDGTVMDALRTGDYIGIYSEKAGLDVSHVGIFIRTTDGEYLRHASSAKEFRKVVDQEFRSYISHKPGIIILRPK